MELGADTKELLELIDANEAMCASDLGELLEFEIHRDTDDDRRWSRSVTSLMCIGERYFLLHWEQGLTENQEDAFQDKPVEVFKRSPKHLTRVFKITPFATAAGKTIYSTEEEVAASLNSDPV